MFHILDLNKAFLFVGAINALEVLARGMEF